MAEGLVEGIIGGEEEKPETEPPEALAGAEAFASAIAAIASKQDPGVARKTEDFLDKQAHLLEIQAEHLKDEHPLRLNQLRHKTALMRGQRIGQAVRVTFQVIAVLIFLGFGVVFVVMVTDALRSRSVVVDSFEISPSLASENLTGRLVASRLVDRLEALQAYTNDVEESKEKVENAWSKEIDIQVPEAGLSVGQIERLLRSRFGHDQHITGDLVKLDQ